MNEEIKTNLSEEELREKLRKGLSKRNKSSKDDCELLKKFTPFLSEDASNSERRYYFLHNLTEIPKCPVCGKKVKFDSKKKRIKVFCSVECYRSAEGNKLTNDKINEKKKNQYKIHRLSKKEIRKNLKRMMKEYEERQAELLYSNLSDEEKRKCLRDRLTESGLAWKYKLFNIERKMLIKYTDFLPEDTSIVERKFYFEFGLNEIQRCVVCGKRILFKGNERRIKNFCSEKCRVSKEGTIKTGVKIGKSLRERKQYIKKEDLKEYGIEINDENREQIRDELKNRIILLERQWSKKISKEDYYVLFEFTSFLPDNVSISERRYYFIHNLDEVQKCPVCGKGLRFLKEKHKLSEYCSDKCRNSIAGKNVNLYKIRYRHFKSFVKVLHKRNLKPIFSNKEYGNARNGSILKFECEVCGNIFNYTIKDNHRILIYNILCRQCYKKSTSSGENEIYEWLKSLGIENIERNKRKWGKKKRFEADIFLPDYNLAIEFNGIYWHSTIYKKSDYHLKKYNYFKKLNIDCIQIFENEWIMRKEIVKSMIMNKLNLSKVKINANDCSLRELNEEECKLFIEQNYIKDYETADIKIGLFYNNELVQCLGLKKEENEWEIMQNCLKMNYSIIGGLCKMIEYFKEFYKGNIIFYVDKRFYAEKDIFCEFKFKKRLKPKCYYFRKNDSSFLVNKTIDRKELNNYLVVYDCGYDVYILKK